MECKVICKLKLPKLVQKLMTLKNYLATLADLLTSSKNFNSLSVVSKDGVVLATSPELGIVGKKLDTEGPKEALL